MRIRYTSINDFDDLVALDKDSGVESPLDTGKIIGFIGTRGTRVYTVEEGEGNIIGFAMIKFEEKAISVYRLLIHKDYRRNKFATKCIEKFTSLMEEHGKSTIYAIVSEIDSESILFWASLGAKSKLIPKHFGDRDGILYTLHGGAEL